MRMVTIVKVSMLSLCVSTLLYAKETEKVNKLEEVIVTANKIEENLQNVPQSISVMDEEIIQEKSIKNITDIIAQVPNMNYFESYGHSLNFRGLNTSAFTGNNPVVIYIDGIPITNRYGFDMALANAQSVEVLRGPQGTLYGKDAIGGVINIITKKPRDVLGGNVEFEYSSYNTFNGWLNLSGPLIDEKLYFGLNAEGTKSDGWITNTYKNDDKAAQNNDNKVGAYLLAHPNDKLSIRLSVAHEGFDKDKVLDFGKTPPVPLNKIDRESTKNQAWDIDENEKSSSNSSALNIQYDFDKLKLTSATTYRKTDVEASYDSDFGINPAYNGLNHGNTEKDRELTQEFRISNKDENIKWVGGLYFDTGKHQNVPQYMQHPGIRLEDYAKQKHRTAAIFGQVKFPVMDKLDMTLGARVQRLKKEIDNKFIPIPEIPAYGYLKHNYEDEKTWNAFLPKIALNYKINNNLTPYVSASKGYMPGGFNFFAMSGGAKENSFKPQQSTNYEIGIKGLYDNLTFSANVFRMDIKDVHVFKTDAFGNYNTSNAEKAHSQGIEFDFAYLPTNEFEISGAFGYIDARYDEYNTGLKSLNGEKIEHTPQFSANLSLAYYHENGFYGRIDGRALGKTSYFVAGTQNMETIGSTFTADMKLGYKVADFDIYGFVRNITDEERITAYFNDGQQSSANFNDPRSFGFGIKYDF